jgi:hypothetical protein
MYGAMLGAPQPMGAPPPIKPPTAGPSPLAPPPAPAAPPQAPTPQAGPTPAPAIPPQVLAAQQAQAEAKQRQAYEDHLNQFLWHAANDYASHRISRDDLKKAASYSGTQPYSEWRSENVQHLKETAKASE